MLDGRFHVHYCHIACATDDLTHDAAHGSMRPAESASAGMVNASTYEHRDVVCRFLSIFSDYFLEALFKNKPGLAFFIFAALDDTAWNGSNVARNSAQRLNEIRIGITVNRQNW